MHKKLSSPTSKVWLSLKYKYCCLHIILYSHIVYVQTIYKTVGWNKHNNKIRFNKHTTLLLPKVFNNWYKQFNLNNYQSKTIVHSQGSQVIVQNIS